MVALMGTYPLTPLFASIIVGYACACEEGGTVMGLARDCSRGFFGFYGVIHSPKAIRTARETNLQKAMRSPFPCRKGGRGDRSAVGRCGVIRVICVIRLIRDSDTVER